MENVVKRGTASAIYSPNFSMAGKTGTAKKLVLGYRNTEGKYIKAHYSNQLYVASFAGFFPAKNPKYSCIVVIHEPKKEKGYYGATVAAPVFKEIAQKIYTSTVINVQDVSDTPSFTSINKLYQEFDKDVLKAHKVIPNVKGMPGMDAVSLLENIGLKVKFTGSGKVKSQSKRKGTLLKKGDIIILKLS